MHKTIPFSAAKYWEERYYFGRGSGPGSLGRLGQYKARVVSQLITAHEHKSVLDLGCGDGSQIVKLNLPGIEYYHGYDISETGVALARTHLQHDNRFKFDVMTESVNFPRDSFDVALSLDVLFHLIDSEAYSRHLSNLFTAAKDMVVIYAPNTNQNPTGQDVEHVRFRRFSEWIYQNRDDDWTELEMIKNPFPYSGNLQEESFCNFHIYTKRRHATKKSRAKKGD